MKIQVFNNQWFRATLPTHGVDAASEEAQVVRLELQGIKAVITENRLLLVHHEHYPHQTLQVSETPCESPAHLEALALELLSKIELAHGRKVMNP
jgi:hypothetical protein